MGLFSAKSKAFENECFTLFRFKNECDFTHKTQFDIVHCTDLNDVDELELSLFGNKVRFGSFEGVDHWRAMKRTLLGQGFADIRSWYVMSVQSIDTFIDGMEQLNCYYVLCAEDQMHSQLLVWKLRFYYERQPYGHE